MFKKKTILLVWILLASCSQVQPNPIKPSINNFNQNETNVLAESSIKPSSQSDNIVVLPTNPTGATGNVASLGEDKPENYVSPVETSNPLPQVSGAGSLSVIGTIKNNPLLSREITTNKQGYTGSYLEVMNNVVIPLVENYAKDVKLIRISGGADKLGKTINRKFTSSFPDISEMPPYYEWQFYFVSAGKKESYTIRVNYQETIITKEKWSNNDFGFNSFNIEEIKLDSTDVYKIFENAVKDKNILSKKVVNPRASNIIEVYEFQDDRDYNFIIERKKQNLVCNIYTNELIERQFMEKILKFPPENRNPKYSYSATFEHASANINVVTGEIIDFSRPTGIYFIDENSTYFQAP